jgi:hypothetical protein
MPEPNVAHIQRLSSINSRIRKKKADAEAAKRQRAEKKKHKAGQTHASTASDPQVVPDIFDEPSTSGVPSDKRKQKRKRTENAAGGESDGDDSDQPPCLHPDDPANFLLLSRALRILLARELTEDQVREADDLLRKYCSELVEVRITPYVDRSVLTY